MKNFKQIIPYIITSIVVIGGVWLIKYPISSQTQLNKDMAWKTLDGGDLTIQYPADWTVQNADGQLQLYAPDTNGWPLRIDSSPAGIYDPISQIADMVVQENGKILSRNTIMVNGKEGDQTSYSLPALSLAGKEVGIYTYFTSNNLLYTVGWEASPGDECWEICPKILSTLQFK